MWIYDYHPQGGISPYQFIWEELNEDGNWSIISGESNSSITNLNAGFYAVTIEDLNSTGGSCFATDTVEITEPILLDITNNTILNVSCFGGNDGDIDITVEGGCEPYTYAWSNGEITQDISNLSAGTYSVDITDDNSCTEAIFFEITCAKCHIHLVNNKDSIITVVPSRANSISKIYFIL